MNVGRQRLLNFAQLAVHCVGDFHGVSIRLLQDVDQHRGAAVRRDDVVDRPLSRNYLREIFHQDWGTLHNIDDRIFDLRFAFEQSCYSRQIQVIVFLHHPRRLDDVAAADGVHHFRERHAVAVQLFRIDYDVILGRPPADDPRLRHTWKPIKARRKIVVRQIPQVRQSTGWRGNAESDHREHREGEPVYVETRARRQVGCDLRNPALHQMQRVQDVHVPTEENVDFGGAAAGDRSHGSDAWNQADRLFERPCHCQHLDIDWSDAVIDQNHDPRKVCLGENGNRNAGDHEHAGKREAQDYQDQPSAMCLNKVRDGARHFPPSAPVPAKVTCVPSGRP